MLVNPRITHQSTSVKIIIQKDEANRNLILEWYLFPGFENRKFWDIQGAQTERVFNYTINFTETGEWTVRAKLVKNNGNSKIDTTTVIVN